MKGMSVVDSILDVVDEIKMYGLLLVFILLGSYTVVFTTALLLTFLGDVTGLIDPVREPNASWVLIRVLSWCVPPCAIYYFFLRRSSMSRNRRVGFTLAVAAFVGGVALFTEGFIAGNAVIGIVGCLLSLLGAVFIVRITAVHHLFIQESRRHPG